MNILKYISILSILLYLTSCEHVIDIDLPTAPPRLVVEGNLDFDANNKQDTISINLSLTTDFYNPQAPKVHNATVWVEDGNGNKHPFKELNNTGRYISTSIKKDFVKNKYKLHIEYDNDIYEATESLVETPKIERLEQRREKFFNDYYYTIRIYFQDTDKGNNKLNYYYTNLLWENKRPALSVRSNEFSKGQLIEDISTDKDYKPGDKIQIDLHQISRNYYDYIWLINDALNNGGGPFQTPISKIKGNVKNLTTPDKEALGYFRVTEKQSIYHTIFEQPKP